MKHILMAMLLVNLFTSNAMARRAEGEVCRWRTLSVTSFSSNDGGSQMIGAEDVPYSFRHPNYLQYFSNFSRGQKLDCPNSIIWIDQENVNQRLVTRPSATAVCRVGHLLGELYNGEGSINISSGQQLIQELICY